eukprot:TRINITY_DN211_c0_g2_i1.p1 TRINITY_DN211_c0_g2~~TRINITY_DN211_c0_g2_i1.p1  ORF type:complete len:357 (+),score=67.40 TRINITY_DN211_c0_g2_i1:60-1130(+)
MKLVIFISIIIVLLSSVDGKFVFDRKLLNNTRRSGSVLYGSFTYNGQCPTTIQPLPGISIHSAATGSCFTDNSLASVDEDVGYICFPGTPATIQFSFPGTNGFIIGGPSFIATGASVVTGYTWGRIGLPTFGAPTTASCTASCVASCSASYCNPTCTAKCASNPSCVGSDNSVTCTNTYTGGTLYFIPTGYTPDNCGTSGGFCCSAFSYPEPTQYRYWKITADQLGASGYWQLSEFNFLKLGNRIPSNSQTAVDNDGAWPNGGSPGASENVNKIDDDNKDTKYLAAKKSSVVFDFGSAKSFDQYQWYTANDAPTRDMTAWTLYASNDNSVFTQIDLQTGQSTSARKALVGPFSIST